MSRETNKRARWSADSGNLHPCRVKREGVDNRADDDEKSGACADLENCATPQKIIQNSKTWDLLGSEYSRTRRCGEDGGYGGALQGGAGGSCRPGKRGEDEAEKDRRGASARFLMYYCTRQTVARYVAHDRLRTAKSLPACC